MKKKAYILLTVIAAAVIIFALLREFVPVGSGEQEVSVESSTLLTSATNINEADRTEFNEEVTEEITEEVVTLPEPIDGIITIISGEYTYQINKSNFEDDYSEQELLEFTEMFSMKFGYEDYHNWNGEGEKVINDLIKCCIPTLKFPYKRIFTVDNSLKEKAIKELSEYSKTKSLNFAFVSLDDLNEYIKDMFGDKAREFESSDFKRIDYAVQNEKVLGEGATESYHRIYYLPESDLLCFTTTDTGFSSYSSYVYDIQKTDGDVVVYTLGYLENFGFGEGFYDRQAYMYKYLTWPSPGYYENYVYIFSYSEDGDLYLKSVDKKFLFSKELKSNYYVNNSAEVIEFDYYSDSSVVIAELKKDSEVYVKRFYDYNGYEYAYVITESFSGYVESKYLTKIRDN